VCKLAPSAPIPVDILTWEFTVFLRTPDEVTLICPTTIAPIAVKVESGWIALELVGPFDFGQTGILMQVAKPLAASGVAIYALSTFNTDYVLVKADKRTLAQEALQKTGHRFIED